MEKSTKEGMSDLSRTCGEGLHDDIFIGEVSMKLEAALLVSIHTAALFPVAPKCTFAVKVCFTEDDGALA